MKASPLVCREMEGMAGEREGKDGAGRSVWNVEWGGQNAKGLFLLCGNATQRTSIVVLVDRQSSRGVLSISSSVLFSPQTPSSSLTFPHMKRNNIPTYVNYTHDQASQHPYPQSHHRYRCEHLTSSLVASQTDRHTCTPLSPDSRCCAISSVTR